MAVPRSVPLSLRAVPKALNSSRSLRLGVPQDRLFRERLPLIEPHFPVLLRRLDQKAGTLSGGEQKMLLISRAIIARPRLMLVDEISEGLQPSVVDRLAGVLAAERRMHGAAMLLGEQNGAFALAVADRAYAMTGGRVVLEADASEAGLGDRLEHAYLGAGALV